MNTPVIREHLAASASHQPLVSVIVPNYNHAKYLPERLTSILNQSQQDFELIVLDDASSDASLDVIRALLADRPYQLITNPCNSGSPCSQWLKGIERSRGKIIWIAESDDSCSTDFLATMVRLIQEGNVLAYSRSRAIDEHGNPMNDYVYWPDQHDPRQWQDSFQWPAADFVRRHMLSLNCIPNASAAVFEREAALACLAMREQLTEKLFIGDWLFWMQLLIHSNRTIAYTADELSFFRHHTTSTRSISTIKAKDQRRIREYCAVVAWICQQKLLPGRWRWLRHALRRDWEWMLSEYLCRLKPSRIERFTARGLCGPLAWSLPIRLWSTPHLRRLFLTDFFPSP